MDDQRLSPTPREREWVALCLRDLRVARADLLTARHDPGLRWRKHILRAQLLAALECYAAAITAIGAPIPHRLHAEIDLYRGLQRHD